MKKKTVIYMLCGAIGLLVILCLIVLWQRRGQEGFQNTTTSTVGIVADTEYLYAGYHDLYDFVISSKITSAIKEIQFQDIPRLYVFVSKTDPLKCRVVFSKLKKSPVVVNLYNNTLIADTPDTNKTVDPINTPERSSISDEDYTKVIGLINKHNMPTSFKIDMVKEFKKQIQSYYRYMDLFKMTIAHTILFTKEEQNALEISNTLPSGAEKSLIFNTGYPKDKPDITFTNLLNRPNVSFDYVTKPETVQDLMNIYNRILTAQCRAFLFNNSRLGTNISDDRIKLFKLEFINAYQVSLFYILQPYTGTMELSNTEFNDKLQSILVPDMSPAKISEFAKLKKMNPKASYIPDSYFYLLYNDFQLIKVIVKKKES